MMWMHILGAGQTYKMPSLAEKAAAVRTAPRAQSDARSSPLKKSSSRLIISLKASSSSSRELPLAYPVCGNLALPSVDFRPAPLVPPPLGGEASFQHAAVLSPDSSAQVNLGLLQHATAACRSPSLHSSPEVDLPYDSQANVRLVKAEASVTPKSAQSCFSPTQEDSHKPEFCGGIPYSSTGLPLQAGENPCSCAV